MISKIRKIFTKKKRVWKKDQFDLSFFFQIQFFIIKKFLWFRATHNFLIFQQSWNWNEFKDLLILHIQIKHFINFWHQKPNQFWFFDESKRFLNKFFWFLNINKTNKIKWKMNEKIKFLWHKNFLKIKIKKLLFLISPPFGF